MGHAVVRQLLAVRLQRLVVALLQRAVERLERGVHLVALDEDPGIGGGEEHVLVVAQTAHALLVDLPDLGGGPVQHVEASDLHRGHRGIDEEGLRHQLVHLLEVLDHPVELELRGGDLPLHERHPQIEAVQRLRRRQRLRHDNLLVPRHLGLRLLDGPRRTHLPAGHLRLHPLLPRQHDVLHARHRGLHLPLDQESGDHVPHDEGQHAEERTPAIAECISEIEGASHADAQQGTEDQSQHKGVDEVLGSRF